MPKIGVEHSTSPGNHDNQSFFEIRAGPCRSAPLRTYRVGPCRPSQNPCRSVPVHSALFQNPWRFKPCRVQKNMNNPCRAGSSTSLPKAMASSSPPSTGEPIGLWTAWLKRLPAACPLPVPSPRSCAAPMPLRRMLPACSELSHTLPTISVPAC